MIVHLHEGEKMALEQAIGMFVSMLVGCGPLVATVITINRGRVWDVHQSEPEPEQPELDGFTEWERARIEQIADAVDRGQIGGPSDGAEVYQ